MKIVALDPGGTTGITTYHDNPEGWAWDHIGPQEHHRDLWERLYEELKPWKQDGVIVCESFEFRSGKQRDNINLMSREYIGLVKLFAAINSTPVVFQTAALGKGFVSDDKLKIMGLYQKGMRHANDSTRHLVYYLVNTRKRYDLIQSWKEL